MKVTYDSSFKREYKIWQRQNPDKKDLVIQAINLFIENTFHPLLRTHKLRGKLKDCYSFTIVYDLRIVFYFEDAEHAVL